MKTIRTYSVDELKGLAHINYHKMRKILEDKGIHPIHQRPIGNRMANYYGEEALVVARELAKAKQDKKDAKKAKEDVKAARIAMGLKVGRGQNYTKMPVLQQQQELPLEVTAPKKKPAEELVVNKVVNQLSRIADAMERLAAAWEARPSNANVTYKELFAAAETKE